MKLTKQQPKRGEKIVHCGHLVHPRIHYWRTNGRINVELKGLKLTPDWVAVCHPCAKSHGFKAKSPLKFNPLSVPIKGHGAWTEPTANGGIG